MSASGEVLLEVDGVSKKFCRDLKRSLWYGVRDIASDCLGQERDHDLRRDEFWALKDVSFQLRRGECLGLIGANGAGKTTLLRLISGLIKPDRGVIRRRGRVGALIALGAGFNPVLTGRENIFVNAAILGLTRKETHAKLDEIIAFADIGDAIDAPVQSYSSGMTVRLGFAIAAHLEPDLLLIDEVLAVGDSGFRGRCYSRIDDLRQSTAVIFVSHFMPHVARIATQGMYLNAGISTYYSDPSSAIAGYHTQTSAGGPLDRPQRNSPIKLISTSSHPDCSQIRLGDAVRLTVVLDSDEAIPVVVDFTFSDYRGEAIAECSNYTAGENISLRKGLNRITALIPVFTLNPGSYSIGIYCLSPNMLSHYLWIENAIRLKVKGRQATAPQQFIPQWEVEWL